MLFAICHGPPVIGLEEMEVVLETQKYPFGVRSSPLL